jgi:transcriptional regulator with XRE-family HTH domain
MGFVHQGAIDCTPVAVYPNSMSNSTEHKRNRLRDFMHSRGLRPSTWAKAAKVSPNALYNFLNQHSSSLSLETVERLARAAGVSVDELFGVELRAGESTSGVTMVQVYELEGVVSADELGKSVGEVALIPHDDAVGADQADRLVGFRTSTNPMAPAIKRHDTILVDPNLADPIEGGIFVCVWRGRAYLREIIVEDGLATLQAYDPDFATHREIPVDDVSVIGRVVHRMGPV